MTAEEKTPPQDAETPEALSEAPAGNDAEERIAEFREKWMRTAADLDNVRKRAARQLAVERKRERENVLASFLGVIDNLERALESHADEEPNPWFEGTSAILRQMLDVLASFGAAPFESAGEPFDPTRHEAVARIPDPERPEGVVAEVTQVGYAMQDGTVLRPAKVVVSYRPSEES